MAVKVEPAGYITLEPVHPEDDVVDKDGVPTWESHERVLGGFGRHEVTSETFKVKLVLADREGAPVLPHPERITITVLKKENAEDDIVVIGEFVHKIRIRK